MRDVWIRLEHAYGGETVVKAHGIKYLPPTKSMLLDGMNVGQIGYETYRAYLMRTVFPGYYKEAVESNIGIMFRNDPVVQLPEMMEPLRENITADGESILDLMRRVAVQQLTCGRCGLLADLPEVGSATTLPYVALYNALSMRNWDDGTQLGGKSRLNLMVLDETGPQRFNIFEWRIVTRYRVLLLGDPVKDESIGVYKQGLFTDADGGTLDYADTVMMTPSYKGKSLNTMPFVVINAKDTLSTVDVPPLQTLADLCYSIYLGEADYRQNLHMSGQDTLVVVGDRSNSNGADSPLRVGAGAVLYLDTGSSAEYIGVNSDGLSEQRSSIENDRKRAEQRSSQLATQSKSQAESGDALETRLAAQTANLTQIAKAAAGGVEKILKLIASWIGANPDEVTVTPNLDFADSTLEGQDILAWVQARKLGAPLSMESLHDWLAGRGYTKLDYDAEMQRIQKENTLYPFLAPVVETQTNPQNPQSKNNNPSGSQGALS